MADITTIKSPLFTRITNVPKRLDIGIVDKLHYFSINAKIVLMALLGKTLDCFNISMERSQKILQYFSGIVVDNSDKAFIDRRFGDTSSMWFIRTAPDTYIMDLSNPLIYTELAFTTGASYLRTRSYFTNKNIIKITLIDESGEYDYYPPTGEVDENTAYKWILAKAYVEANCMQLNVLHHTLTCHFLTQWYNASLHKTLTPEHPLMAFLEDYFDANVALEGLTKIFGLDFFYDVDMTEAHLDTRSMHVFQDRLLRVMHNNDFYHLDVITRLRDNNLPPEDMPDYYLFGNAIVNYYNLEKELIVRIVNQIYPTEQDIKNDSQINNWWRMFYDGNSMTIKDKKLSKDNLINTLMILVSILLDHGLEHATAGKSFSSAYELPLRVNETRANLHHLDNAKEFYYKNALGGNVLILSQAAISKGYATDKLSKIVRKTYKMWGEHTYPDLGDYKTKMEAYQSQLRSQNSYYLAEYIPLSVRD